MAARAGHYSGGRPCGAVVLLLATVGGFFAVVAAGLFLAVVGGFLAVVEAAFFGAGLFILASTSAAHAFSVVRGSTPGKHGARADSKHAPPFAPGAHTGDEDVPLLT